VHPNVKHANGRPENPPQRSNTSHVPLNGWLAQANWGRSKRRFCGCQSVAPTSVVVGYRRVGSTMGLKAVGSTGPTMRRCHFPAAWGAPNLWGLHHSLTFRSAGPCGTWLRRVELSLFGVVGVVHAVVAGRGTGLEILHANITLVKIFAAPRLSLHILHSLRPPLTMLSPDGLAYTPSAQPKPPGP
jgi:hypothetical protein